MENERNIRERVEYLKSLEDFVTNFAIENSNGSVDILVNGTIGRKNVLCRIINNDVDELINKIDDNARITEFIQLLTLRFRLLFNDASEYQQLINLCVESVTSSGFSDLNEGAVISILTETPYLVPLIFITANYFTDGECGR